MFLRGGGRGGWYPNEHCGCIVSIAVIALNLSVFFLSKSFFPNALMGEIFMWRKFNG